MPHAPILPVIAGPTAVGKTALSLRVAAETGAEIVSADSMAVYRGLEVATAKPDAAQRAAIRHHLVDIVDVAEPFSVADYHARATAAISDIRARGHMPLVVGGTRQYLDALTRGFVEAPPSNAEIRARLEGDAAREGLPSLRTRLESVDPAAARRIHPNDLRRTVRALEVFEISERPISAWQTESRAGPPPFHRLLFALAMDRERLYARIHARVDAMMAAGLADEVRNLLDAGRLGPTAVQGHGYKEIAGALRGEYPLERGVYLLKRNTRWHARHQLSWLRGQPDAIWMNVEQPEDTSAATIVDTMRKAEDESDGR